MADIVNVNSPSRLSAQQLPEDNTNATDATDVQEASADPTQGIASSDTPLLNIGAHGLMLAAMPKGNTPGNNGGNNTNSPTKPDKPDDKKPAEYDDTAIKAAAFENGKLVTDGITTIAGANGDEKAIRDGAISIVKGVMGTAISLGKLPENSQQLTEIAEGALKIYEAKGDPAASQEGAEQIAKAIATLSGKEEQIAPYLDSGSKIATGIRTIIDGSKSGNKDDIASGVQSIIEGSFGIGQRLIHLEAKGVPAPNVNLTVSDEARSDLIDGAKGLLSDDKIAGASKLVDGLSKIAEDNLSLYGEIPTTEAPEEEEAPEEPADPNGAIFPDDMEINANTQLPAKEPSSEQRQALFIAAKAALEGRDLEAYKGYADIMDRSKPDANKAIDYLRDQVIAGKITKQEAYGLAALTQVNANAAGSGKINNAVRDGIKQALGLDYDIIGPGKTRAALFFTGALAGAVSSAISGGRRAAGSGG